MNAATLIDNFDLLAEAPGGVRKLRELILQLAVRGKLVEQREEEGDGEGKEGAVDGPYPVPKAWQWTTLKNIGEVNPRNEADDSSEVGFAPMAAISQEYGIEPDYERRTWGDVKKGFTHFADGDVGVAKITPCFQNGKSAVFRNLPNGIGAGTTELHVFRPATGAVMPDYVWIWLKSPRFLRDGEAQMTGSAGQKRVPRAYFAETPFPLPPLAEQKRIVARVDELMKRCDALEARQNERNERHKALISSCLHALVLKPETRNLTPSTFSSILQPSNFNLLLATPESVAELRKTILQLAVQGRLVPQIADEGPVHHEEPAFAKATADKHERGEGKRVSFDRTCSVQPGWREMPLNEIGVWAIGSGFPTRCQGETIGQILFCKVSDMNLPGNELRIERTVNTVDVEMARSIRARIHPAGSVVFPKIGGAIATNKRRILAKPTAIDNNCLGLTPRGECTTEWLYLVLSAIDFSAYQSGTSVPALTQGKIGQITVFLPPLAEQKRIVAKVNELMAMCDALGAKLTKAREGADILATAVVHGIYSDRSSIMGAPYEL
jgi:type I restriction enzyme, S subunit